MVMVFSSLQLLFSAMILACDTTSNCTRGKRRRVKTSHWGRFLRTRRRTGRGDTASTTGQHVMGGKQAKATPNEKKKRPTKNKLPATEINSQSHTRTLQSFTRTSSIKLNRMISAPTGLSCGSSDG